MLKIKSLRAAALLVASTQAVKIQSNYCDIGTSCKNAIDLGDAIVETYSALEITPFKEVDDTPEKKIEASSFTLEEPELEIQPEKVPATVEAEIPSFQVDAETESSVLSGPITLSEEERQAIIDSVTSPVKLDADILVVLNEVRLNPLLYI